MGVKKIRRSWSLVVKSSCKRPFFMVTFFWSPLSSSDQQLQTSKYMYRAEAEHKNVQTRVVTIIWPILPSGSEKQLQTSKKKKKKKKKKKETKHRLEARPNETNKTIKNKKQKNFRRGWSQLSGLPPPWGNEEQLQTSKHRAEARPNEKKKATKLQTW